MIVPLVAALALLQTPPPDRSGEGALRKLVSWASRLDQVHVAIFKSAREKAGMPFYPDSRIDFWKAGKRFRIEMGSFWGDGLIVVGDGKTVLRDPCTEDEDATLSDQGDDLRDSLEAVRQETDDLSPLFWLFGDLDHAAPKAAKITATRETVTVSHETMGEVVFTVTDGEVVKIEYDNEPEIEQEAKFDPDMEEFVGAGGLNRQVIVISRDRAPGGLFSTKPAKGRSFVDLRKAKKKG